MSPIAGLELYPGWIGESHEVELLSQLGPAGRRASGTQRNRIERYGPGVPDSGYTEAQHYDPVIPAPLLELGARLALEHVMDLPDAITVGWYLPGQSMRPHVDSIKAGEVIAILALASSAVMRFTPGPWPSDHPIPPTVDVEFSRRMLLVMRGEARWQWLHEILPVAAERVSIVFRRARP